MSTPTVINEEYDIVIAGGEPPLNSYSFRLVPSANRVDVRPLYPTVNRRYGGVRHCRSSRCCRREPACPLTRGGSHHVQ